MSRLYHDAGPRAVGQKVLLATVVYDSPDAGYTFALQKSRAALERAGIQSAYLLLSGNCHVDDSRNTVVKEFLLTDCTDLVFLDADVSWDPDDLVKLCRYDLDLVGGVYPYRREDLRKAGGMPVRLMPRNYEPDENGLLEVHGLPTGFMRIRRNVIETLVETSESFWTKDRRRRTPLLFERTLEGETRWGGDLKFCNRWRDAGGKVYAATEIRLGHVAKTVVSGSLAASLRAEKGQTLRHVAKLIRERRETDATFLEVSDYVGNPWGMSAEGLALCVLMARKAEGPIIETGSGLTTVLMAAANPDQTVWCVEHSEHYADVTEAMARNAGILNIAICVCPVRDGWYGLSEEKDLPESFALGVNDGPPRMMGGRMGFFDAFRVETIICDDADDPDYLAKLKERGTVDLVSGRLALVRR